MFEYFLGPENVVASTKATTCQLTTLACLAVAAAADRGNITADQVIEYTDALRHVPTVASEILYHDGAITTSLDQ